ncbi:MAG: cytochrome c3 family protein [Deltaproteobacteria bacterium]|nr:cytochrome c3 family protein [Deltaproteobacteria bacterium]
MMTRTIPLTLIAALVLASSCGPPPPVDEVPPPVADAGASTQEDAQAPPAQDASTTASGAADAPPPGDEVPEQDPGPATIVLAEGSKQGTITFGHKEHEDRLDCMKCHHEMEDAQGEARSCHDCHNPQAVDTFGAKKAFHLQCLGCHKQEKKGPAKCAGCHQK